MMFGIPLHYIVIAAVIALFGTYRGGYHFGWKDRDSEMQIEIAKKNEESRAKEQKLTEQINVNATKLQEANNVLTEKTTALDRAIRAGRVRLPTASCVQTAATPAPAAVDRNETTSQPDRPADPAPDAERATLQAIAEIVAQGDRNAMQLNACIDAYNDARNLLNGKS